MAHFAEEIGRGSSQPINVGVSRAPNLEILGFWYTNIRGGLSGELKRRLQSKIESVFRSRSQLKGGVSDA